jgi:hypothetical protein
MTRAEILKNKTLCSMIKPLKVFRNNKSGARFTIQHVKMEPIDEGQKWFIECTTQVNGRPLPFNIQFEELANGLTLNEKTLIGVYTLIK